MRCHGLHHVGCRSGQAHPNGQFGHEQAQHRSHGFPEKTARQQTPSRPRCLGRCQANEDATPTASNPALRAWYRARPARLFPDLAILARRLPRKYPQPCGVFARPLCQTRVHQGQCEGGRSGGVPRGGCLSPTHEKPLGCRHHQAAHHGQTSGSQRASRCAGLTLLPDCQQRPAL